MRTAITISLPPAVDAQVRKEIKSGGFASMSEYFRHIHREYQRAKLAKELAQDDAAFDRGEGIVLKSLKDLR